MENFEQRLSRQPLRKIPPEWRAEVLTAASKTQAARQPSLVTRHGWLSTLNSQLSTLLWPHPKAWAGLAAIWVFIFVLNFSMRDTTTQMMAEKSSPPSPEMIAELKKQQRMFAELVGPREEPVADRSKNHPPRPRTWRVEFLAV